MSKRTIELDRRVEARVMRIFLPSFVKSGTPWILRGFALRPDRAIDGPPVFIATALASCSTSHEGQMALFCGCRP